MRLDCKLVPRIPIKIIGKIKLAAIRALSRSSLVISRNAMVKIALNSELVWGDRLAMIDDLEISLFQCWSDNVDFGDWSFDLGNNFLDIFVINIDFEGGILDKL